MIKFTGLINEGIDSEEYYRQYGTDLALVNGKVPVPKDKASFLKLFVGRNSEIRIGSGGQSMIKWTEKGLIESMIEALTHILWDQDYYHDDLDRDEQKEYYANVQKFARKLAKGNWKTTLKGAKITLGGMAPTITLDEKGLYTKYKEGIK